jgi:hypothetical protein
MKNAFYYITLYLAGAFLALTVSILATLFGLDRNPAF